MTHNGETTNHNYGRLTLRLTQVVAAVALLCAILLMWQHQVTQRSELLYSKADGQAEQIVQFAAIAAAPALAEEKDDQLQWLVDSLVQDSRILSATLFSADGQRLFQAQSLFPLSQLPEESVLEAALDRFDPFVAEVILDEQSLGYLRIRTNTHLFFIEQRRLERTLIRQQPLMMLMAGLVGALLTLVLSTRRLDINRRRKQLKAAMTAKTKEPEEPEKSAREEGEKAAPPGEKN
ncbi:AhpA/YtjB family protein [Ferrimonas sp.]|uniref:AhpA/YtjB family protein n=1 Tax=Ferrimonas sp. TaxID=2080861 RepID=UPI003A9241A1